LRTFGLQKEKGAVILIVNACSSRDVTENVVGVCFVGQDVTGQKQVLDKFTRIQGDYKAIVMNPNPLIPPIFGTDEYGYCSEWNPSMEKLTGWKREEVGSLFLSCMVDFLARPRLNGSIAELGEVEVHSGGRVGSFMLAVT
jgi:PAS domain-containing protein